MQLRRISDGYAYAPDTGFAANLTRGYYPANISAATSDTAETRTWNREMSWVPPANQMAPGNYSILLYPQDNAGNYSAEYVTITISPLSSLLRFLPA